jgi:hypothetical protein
MIKKNQKNQKKTTGIHPDRNPPTIFTAFGTGAGAGTRTGEKSQPHTEKGDSRIYRNFRPPRDASIYPPGERHNTGGGLSGALQKEEPKTTISNKSTTVLGSRNNIPFSAISNIKKIN